MIHKLRRFCVKPATLEEIQEDFTYTDSWTACSSYRVEHDGKTYLLLNDAFDGSSSELAICLLMTEGEHMSVVRQLESLTMGWVEPEDIPAALVACFADPLGDGGVFTVRHDGWQDHYCPLCA